MPSAWFTSRMSKQHVTEEPTGDPTFWSPLPIVQMQIARLKDDGMSTAQVERALRFAWTRNQIDTVRHEKVMALIGDRLT